MRVRAVGPAWCHQRASQPAQPRIQMNSRKLQRQLRLIGIQCKCSCSSASVRVCTRARSRVTMQVGVNPIRLARFKRWRPGAPKPVTSAHPADASRSSVPNKHSHIPPASYSLPVGRLKSPSLMGPKPACLSGNQTLMGFYQRWLNTSACHVGLGDLSVCYGYRDIELYIVLDSGYRDME